MFVNQGKLYEIYARKVSHGSLFGFVEVEELVFGVRSAVVVDPTEEKVKAEFEGVKRTYLPMHSVLRIDEQIDAPAIGLSATNRYWVDPRDGFILQSEQQLTSQLRVKLVQLTPDRRHLP